jgi:hypothetical protein
VKNVVNLLESFSENLYGSHKRVLTTGKWEVIRCSSLVRSNTFVFLYLHFVFYLLITIEPIWIQLV